LIVSSVLKLVKELERLSVMCEESVKADIDEPSCAYVNRADINKIAAITGKLKKLKSFRPKEFNATSFIRT
jgi:hypothetical protein